MFCVCHLWDIYIHIINVKVYHLDVLVQVFSMSVCAQSLLFTALNCHRCVIHHLEPWAFGHLNIYEFLSENISCSQCVYSANKQSFPTNDFWRTPHLELIVLFLQKQNWYIFHLSKKYKVLVLKLPNERLTQCKLLSCQWIFNTKKGCFKKTVCRPVKDMWNQKCLGELLFIYWEKTKSACKY